MLQLEQLTIEGFRSFSKEQILNIEELPVGLNYVTGTNLVNKSMGSNGSGKSTIAEAIVFAIKGKISSNLKGKVVCNWQNPQLKITLKFTISNKTYTLERKYPANTIELFEDGVKIISTQEELDNIIGLNFEAFLHTVYIDQHSSKFIDIAPSERLEIFTEILGETLQKLDKCITVSATKAKDIEDLIAVCNTQDVRYNETKRTLESISYEKDINEWETLHKNKKTHLTNKLQTIFVELGRQEELVEQLKDHIEKKRIEEKEVDNKSTKKDLAILEEIITELNIKNSDTRALVSHCNMMIDKFSKLSGTCPTCEQKIDKTVIDSHIKYLKDSIETHKKTMEQLYKDSELLNIQKQEYLKVEQERKELSSKLLELSRNLIFETKQVTSYKDEFDRITEEIKHIETQINPFTEKEKQRIVELKNIQEKIVENNATIESHKSALDMYSFWKKNFHLLKLDIIEDSIKELDFVACKVLASFNLQNWDIKFETSTETKSGTQKKGLQILIKNEDCKNYMPFETWSGGERQRLRIAVILSISSFINNRCHTPWNIIIFDEPSQWLSQEGIDDCLEICREYCKENNLKGLLLDQRNLNDYGGFSSTIEILKDKEGSKINVRK